MKVRKSAGRCGSCNKWVGLDDFEVVVDMTAAAMRPSWELYHAKEHTNCGEECFTEVQRLVREMLTEHPLCSQCWHRHNAERPLMEGVLRMTEQGPAAFLPESMQFRWTEVRDGAR